MIRTSGIWTRALATASVVALLVVGGSVGAPAATTAAAASKLKITAAGFTAERSEVSSEDVNLDAAAVVRNPTDKVAIDVVYAVRVKDTKGKLIEESTSNRVDYLLPGESYLVQDMDFFDLGDREVGEVKFRITEIDEFVSLGKWEVFDGNPGTDVAAADLLSFSDLSVQQTDFVFDVLHGSVTNTSDKLLSGSPFSVDTRCALFRDGEVVGGGYDQIKVLPPGQPVALMDKLSQGMDPDEIRCDGTVSPMSTLEVDSDASKFETVDVTLTGTVVDELRVAATIRTTSDNVPTSVSADWEFKDAQGRAVGSAFESFDLGYLLPGVEATVDGGPEDPRFLTGTPASVEIRIAATEYMTPKAFKDVYGFAPDKSPFEVTDVEHSQDNTIATITGTVKNRAKRDFDVLVHCAVYAGDTLLGSAVALDVAVPAKGSASFTEDFGSLAQDITDVRGCTALAKPTYG